jgi:hypothetical protein
VRCDYGVSAVILPKIAFIATHQDLFPTVRYRTGARALVGDSPRAHPRSMVPPDSREVA